MIEKPTPRYPTRAAIDSLAARFNLPNKPTMQDWEYEVADADRIDEFLEAYESGELDDDERFTLMETVIQSFDDLAIRGISLETEPRWQRTMSLLDQHIELHEYSVWYWAAFENEQLDDCWYVTPFMRRLFANQATKP